MDEIKINKNLLLIFRLLMTLIGAAVGIVAIWQVFSVRPELVRSVGLKAVFYIACGTLPAAFMFLTARPLLGVVLAGCEKVKLGFKGVKAVEVAGVFVGLIIGVFFGFVSDAVMRLFLPIIALRIIIAVVLAVVTAYVAAMLCIRFINKAEASDGESESESAESFSKEYTGGSGYVLSGGALKNDRIINVCAKWLTGDIFVLESTAEGFSKTADINPVAADAARRLDELLGSGKVKISDFGNDFENDDDAVISFAFEKNLKILVENGNSIKETSLPVHLLVLDEL